VRVNLAWIVLATCIPAAAAEGNSWTAAIGTGANIPVGKTAQFVHAEGAFLGSLGYRLGDRQAIVGQYFFSGLPFKRTPLEQVKPLDPHSSLLSVSMDYRFSPGTFGFLSPYVIGGGGWYHRAATVTRSTAVGAIACSPLFQWWNYNCEVGFLVPADKVVADATSDAFGFNAGFGTVLFAKHSGPHFFVEMRYHSAPNAGVKTQVLPLLVGLTW